MQETCVQSMGWEDSLEEGMATHSSTLAREFHGPRSLAGYSPWGHRARHNWATNTFFQAHMLEVNDIIQDGK